MLEDLEMIVKVVKVRLEKRYEQVRDQVLVE